MARGACNPNLHLRWSTSVMLIDPLALPNLWLLLIYGEFPEWNFLVLFWKNKKSDLTELTVLEEKTLKLFPFFCFSTTLQCLSVILKQMIQTMGTNLSSTFLFSDVNKNMHQWVNYYSQKIVDMWLWIMWWAASEPRENRLSPGFCNATVSFLNKQDTYLCNVPLHPQWVKYCWRRLFWGGTHLFSLLTDPFTLPPNVSRACSSACSSK